jgi:hypothetical protein
MPRKSSKWASERTVAVTLPFNGKKRQITECWLGMTGSNAFDANAQAQPPDGKLA